MNKIFKYSIFFFLINKSAFSMELTGLRTGLSHEQLIKRAHECIKKRSIAAYFTYELLKDTHFSLLELLEYQPHDISEYTKYTIKCLALFPGKPLIIYNVKTSNFLTSEGTFTPLINTFGKRFKYALDSAQEKVAVLIEGSYLRIFDLLSKKLLYSLPQCSFDNYEADYVMAFNSDALLVALYNADEHAFAYRNIIHIWYVPTGNIVAIIPWEQITSINGLQFSLDGMSLIVDYSNKLNELHYIMIDIRSILGYLSYLTNEISLSQALLLQAVQEKMETSYSKINPIVLSSKSYKVFETFPSAIKEFLSNWINFKNKKIA